RVNGVYDKDPLKHPDAVMYSEVSYLDVLAKGLAVMDASAVAMCRDNMLPIVVFNLNVTGNIMRMSAGEPIGTVIHQARYENRISFSPEWASVQLRQGN